MLAAREDRCGRSLGLSGIVGCSRGMLELFDDVCELNPSAGDATLLGLTVLEQLG
jgi:hypothetical protein